MRTCRADLTQKRTGGPGHPAFVFGVHQCLGQNLARVEPTEVFRRLFRRIPSLTAQAAWQGRGPRRTFAALADIDPSSTAPAAQCAEWAGHWVAVVVRRFCSDTAGQNEKGPTPVFAGRGAGLRRWLDDLELTRQVIRVRRGEYVHTVYLDAVTAELVTAWLTERVVDDRPE